MSVDKEAQEHIEECHVIIDLQREEIEELRAQVKMLKAQRIADLQNRKVDYGVA
jgi:hypothetical protein